jgi:broad specificity phosphatase PhoE
MLLLIRHAACEQMSERLYGRKLAAPLSAAGREQARRLGETLAEAPLDAVRASPRERALDTAIAIAAPHHLPVEKDVALDEIDFGAWSGARFRELDRDAHWRAWNRDREHGAPPGGESIAAVQRRVLACLRALGRSQPGAWIALVSHAEVIRSAILAIRGWSANRWESVELTPASITRVHADGALLSLADDRVREGSER